MTSLYRHFDAEGSLLYVGISLSWPARTKAHAHGSRWFDMVAKVEIERFDTREAALDAEREAIKREKPKFNIIHNRDTKAPAVKRPIRNREFDPVFNVVTGSDAIVGPVLNYRDDMLSFMIAHGEAGKPGELSEVVLGEWLQDIPEWAWAADTVMTIRSANHITLDEARAKRSEVIAEMKKHLRTVEAFDTDIALAVANAARFPSPKAMQILDEVAVEKGAAWKNF
jgi:predicted GIY-YIG superfamily endonuclease